MDVVVLVDVCLSVLQLLEEGGRILILIDFIGWLVVPASM